MIAGRREVLLAEQCLLTYEEALADFLSALAKHDRAAQEKAREQVVAACESYLDNLMAADMKLEHGR
jgi:hypothetical protein